MNASQTVDGIAPDSLSSQMDGPDDAPSSKDNVTASLDTVDENEAAAATKIQASYRGYKARKDLKIPLTNNEDSGNQMNEIAEKDESVTGVRGNKGLPESEEQKPETTKSETETNNIGQPSTITAETLNDGSTKKVIENDVDNSMEPSSDIIGDTSDVDETLETEKDQALAATRIQASYRGYKTRKNLKTTTDKKNSEALTNITESPLPLEEANNMDTTTKSEEDLNLAATKIQATARGYIDRKRIARSHEAATKIQANYRGYKTRKHLKTSDESPLESQPDE